MSEPIASTAADQTTPTIDQFGLLTDTAQEPATVSGPTGPRSRLRFIARTLVRKPGLLLSVLFLLLVLAWAVVPGVFTSYNPDNGIPSAVLHAPSAQYWFGTDDLGRDIYTRIVYGSARSLEAVAIAVVIGFFVGSTVGLVSGFLGGWTDSILMRCIDVLMAIPGLLLALAVVTVLGFGTVHVAIAVGVAAVASFARVMRSEVLRAKGETFVEAAVASGVRRWKILRKHVLPHSLGAVLSLAALEFGSAILAVSSLSFLGFGAPPPAPEWGSLVAEGRDYLTVAWWMSLLPSLIVVLAVLSANRIGRALSSNEREGASR
jgi:peptide/nickel transport system permease protein